MVLPTASVVRDNEINRRPKSYRGHNNFRGGKRDPVDARIVETANLKVEEAALTGESAAALKVATALRAKYAGRAQ